MLLCAQATNRYYLLKVFMKQISEYFFTVLDDQGVKILLSLGLILLFIISASVNLPLAFDGTVPYDFPNYFFGGKRFIEGRPIYDYLESEVFQALGWHNVVYPADPPFTVIILSPLALLSYTQAWIVWALISTILFLVSIFLVAREFSVKSSTLLLTLAVALTAKPFRFLLFTNHFETLVLFLSVLGWIFLRRKYERLGLFMWVLAASLKLFPLLWIVGSVRLVGLRKVVEALLAFLLIFFVSGYFVGIENLKTFLFEIIPRSQLWYGVIANYSLISFGYAFQSKLLAWSLELIFALWVVCDLYAQKRPKIDFQWCLITIESLLLSPLCWWRYLILVFPCILILLFSKESKSASSLKGIVAVLALLIWGWPEIINTSNHLSTVVLSFVPMGVLCCLYLFTRKLALQRTLISVNERDFL